MKRPPQLALWLLRRLVPERDALAGDLLEQGNSGFRVWRQVIGAVFYALVAELRGHPIIAARAIVIGGLFVAITTRILFAILALPEWLFATGIAPSLFRHGVSSPDWMHGFPAVAIWKSILYAASGWLIARTHNRNPLIVLWSAAFIVCANAVWFVVYMADPRSPYSAAQLIADLLVLYPLAALCGGLSATTHTKQHRARA